MLSCVQAVNHNRTRHTICSTECLRGTKQAATPFASKLAGVEPTAEPGFLGGVSVLMLFFGPFRRSRQVFFYGFVLYSQLKMATIMVCCHFLWISPVQLPVLYYS
ncbi:hypothetical protein BRADI_2g48165v3 [Brachypodium distachyon]|uniref:Uncharacterized protein n=1 Tax=Brachypodium distachyon TaxID=15368 RepID=A0A2K2DEL3_BRADI|nr:hypothetical protein BRADI_2g48165v3 [Brachypodium distachyon]